jgi:thiol-disulfide isomerase/thioredoxin
MRLFSALFFCLLFALPLKAQEGLTIFDSFDDFSPLLQQETDGVVVLNFWATWCKPCVEELPFFEKLNKKYADDSSVKVILVSLDFPKQIESRLLPFMQKHDLQSEVVALLDVKANNWIDKVSPEWSGAIPATVIYNSSERLFFEKTYHSFEELERDVNRIKNGRG